MLSVVYAECHYAECHYDVCHYAECHYTEYSWGHYSECHYAECHYPLCHYAECHKAECRGAAAIALSTLEEATETKLFLFSNKNPIKKADARNLPLGACTIKHYGFVIYGKWTGANVIKLFTAVIYEFSQ
jgi:hypothetical protein